MNTTSNRKKLTIAALGAAVTATTLQALALTSAPVAQAACDKWGFTWQDMNWTQTNSTTGTVGGFPNPAPTDPTVFDSFSGAYAWSFFGDAPTATGRASGSVRGDDIHFSVLWEDGAKGVYRGTVDQDGFASGTTSGGGQTANWRFEKPLARCPAPPPPPAPAAKPPEPPPRLPQPSLLLPEFDDSKVEKFEWSTLTVTVKITSNAGNPTKNCSYSAIGDWVPQRPFTVTGDQPGTVVISAIAPGKDWDITIKCDGVPSWHGTHHF